MSSFTYTTRECPVNQLHPNLSQAIGEYAFSHQVGDPNSATRMCCETTAEKRNTGKLASLLEGNPDSTIHLAMLFTDDWFIWARSGDKSGTKVNGIKLKGMQVKAYVMKRTKDMQLEISGIVAGTKEFVKGNLEMGPEAAAQRFCEEIIQLVKKLNPTVKRSFFGLTGG